MKITVKLSGLPVLEITKAQGHGLLWRQTPEYLASGHELFPLEGNRPERTTAWVAEKNTLFECLPGPVYDSLPDAWGMEVLRRRLNLPTGGFSPARTLAILGHIGHDGVGALDYEPAATAKGDDVIERLNLAAAKKEARDLIANAPQTLVKAFANSSSIGGAHPKATIGAPPDSGADGRLPADCVSGVTISRILAANREPWILKFSVPEARDTTIADIERSRAAGRIEYAYHLMAVAAGIPMERCALFVDDEGVGHFATRRFDRKLSGERRVIHSLLSLYHGNTTAMDYRQLMLVAATACGTREAAAGVAGAREAFTRAVFNVAAVVRDDHAKNHAFLYDPKEKSWRMSPAFDLVHTPGRDRHSLSVLGRDFGIGRGLLSELGAKYGIKDAEDIIAKTFGIVADWRRFAERAEVPEAYAETIAREMRQVLDR